MSFLQTAQQLAKLNIPTFPVDNRKRPLTPNGFYDATTDAALQERMFANPLTKGVGVPTGAASGIDALDVDAGGQTWIAEHGGKLGRTRIHRTRSGGFHYLYRHRDGVGSSAGKIADGIDIRGDGGYIVWHPAAGLPVYDKAPVAPMPDWLYETIVTAKPARAATGDVKAPEQVAPPDAATLIAVLDRTPNPLEVDRDTYTALNLSVQGAIRGGLALGRITPEQADDIKDAAARWSSRWEGATAQSFEDEREIWERDWSTRDNDVSGWQNVLDIAHSLGADVRAESAAAVASVFPDDSAEPDEAPRPEPMTDEQRDDFQSLLSIEAWTQRDIPEPDRLLGDVLTTTTRMFLVGRTGLGKTLVGLAIASGVAAGTGFCHWPAGRAARVLYLDGEMPAELIKPRSIDALRRLPCPMPRNQLFIFGRDVDKEARKINKKLPQFAPLNTPEGGRFIHALIEAVGGVDLVVFDNVMSLLSGDQKDEEAWSQTLPLAQSLTDRRMAQLWLDHTGHQGERQYGSSTKAWRFDAVANMTVAKDYKPGPEETAFVLSFDHPGKARRRTPSNYEQFSTRLVRLIGDHWSADPYDMPPEDGKGKKKDKVGMSAEARAQYDVLVKLISEDFGASRSTWMDACVIAGLCDSRDRSRAEWSQNLSKLAVAGWIKVEGDTIEALNGTAS